MLGMPKLVGAANWDMDLDLFRDQFVNGWGTTNLLTFMSSYLMINDSPLKARATRVV